VQQSRFQIYSEYKRFAVSLDMDCITVSISGVSNIQPWIQLLTKEGRKVEFWEKADLE
jgi:hypothetical protein